MNKTDNKDFENSTKFQICHNAYVDDGVSVRNPCHIPGTSRSSTHRDYNINVISILDIIKYQYHKIPVVFHYLKNHDSHLIMQRLSKFNLKINVIQNRSEQCKSFSINNKLSFIAPNFFVLHQIVQLKTQAKMVLTI